MQPIGVLLAGGSGRRLGGDKTLVELNGRPLLHYPLVVLREVLSEVVVVCKEHTPLPILTGMAAVWCESEEERHPLIGVTTALRIAADDDRAVFVCAGDMPLVTADAVRSVLAGARAGSTAVVARAGGRLQPLLGLYEPGALAVLDARGADESATAVVERLDPVVVEIADEQVLFNVNLPEDVLTASALLAEREREGRHA
jgi:molybdopterin-guanine dinucleotide biosynthesis protein A